jgi:phage terminase large subunit
MQCTDLFKWNYYPENFCPKTKEQIKIVINQGGTSSGKTYAILQVLFVLAISQPNQVITVCGQDIPNLKKGALRDAQNIVASNPDIAQYVQAFNVQDRVFVFNNGSVIEFNSYDNAQDAKSGKRDYLFVNEANGISYEVFFELYIRTKQRTFIDYNPNSVFWVHLQILPMDCAVRFISTYKHNKFLSDSLIEKIEEMEYKDPDRWQVYGLGKTGKIKGVVFPNAHPTNEFPSDCKKIRYGLDFGFTNDVTAFVKIGELGGNLYGQELIYQTGLLNKDIAKLIKELSPKNALIYADCSEPKSIAELRLAGLYVLPCAKGKDSVNNGINALLSYPQIYLLGENWNKEAAQYKWRMRDGQAINEPTDLFNHCWDACRYAMQASGLKSSFG